MNPRWKREERCCLSSAGRDTAWHLRFGLGGRGGRGGREGREGLFQSPRKLSVLPSAFYKCAILGNLILQSRYDSVISGTTVNFTWNSSEDSMEGAEHRRPRWIGPQASGTPEI